VDSDGGRWRVVVGPPYVDLLRAMRENTEARMSLEEYLKAAVERTDLDGLTLWRVHQGWQAATRRKGSDGFTVITHADPVQAVLQALVAWRYAAFPEYVGLGEDGPASPAMKALYAALKRNVEARLAFDKKLVHAEILAEKDDQP
jgi:hypothetical protein